MFEKQEPRDSRRKILVVEDEVLNRYMLCKILSEDYEVFMVENGADALKLLYRYGEGISMILLDLIMPVMDGHEFLERFQKEKMFSSVPVIVTTGRDSVEEEIWCLQNGASDYVMKPYKPELVKHRVASIIRLRESASMLNLLKYDRLTGLYSREFFYQDVARILEQNPHQKFDIICSNVENFRLVNERYGSAKGDELLKYIADKYRKAMKEGESCSRMGADTFALLVKHQEYNQKRFGEAVEKGFSDAPVPHITIKFGIYKIEDTKLPVAIMCDYAMMALQRIKKRYGKYLAVYDDSLHIDQMKEVRILENMEQALVERQFKVYYQPKQDLQSGGIVGGEALVRWAHPDFGFISPGDFIPLFEQNGFITKMDYYVWEETLRTLKQWQEKGLPMVPISVNISRVDFDLPDLAQEIINLVDRYGIQHELLHLEVTESAYTDNPRQIIDVINHLRNEGFKIEMDDFGSGYSSLNILSELSIDVLKLDMKFMHGEKYRERKGIVSFIINLGKWLKLSTLAEGVETKEQAESLRSMGCNYAQGYYYSKPISSWEFEKYLKANYIGPEKAAVPQTSESA